jgi:hypothetical protein
MLANQSAFLAASRVDPYLRLVGSNYAVWDWLRLGIFTGSRLSEYAQSRLKKTQRFQIIPVNGETGIWGGHPLAFIQADFQFFDGAACSIPLSAVYSRHKSGTVRSVHIRFRYDKSADNFSIRKYSVSLDPILNPVDAAVSLLQRADLLKVPSLEPIGVYRNTSKTPYSFLRDSHIRDALRAMCVRTYPDPQHYLRLNITRLVPHSNRVTAAVVLHMGGASISDIAFRLRWHEASVPTYLRECFQDVGSIMETAITGAFKTS